MTVGPVERLSFCSANFFPMISLLALYMVAAPLMVATVFFGLRQEVKPNANVVQAMKMIRLMFFLA